MLKPILYPNAVLLSQIEAAGPDPSVALLGRQQKIGLTERHYSLSLILFNRASSEFCSSFITNRFTR